MTNDHKHQNVTKYLLYVTCMENFMLRNERKSFDSWKPEVVMYIFLLSSVDLLMIIYSLQSQLALPCAKHTYIFKKNALNGEELVCFQ